jgi:hypothetical protein
MPLEVSLGNLSSIGSILKKLIFSDDKSYVQINYNDIVFQCQLGNNRLIVGTSEEVSEDCILLIYDENDNTCKLFSFFYNKSKNECIEDNSIDNRKFKSSKQSLEDYNKKLNEKLLEFIDIINTAINIKLCSLNDLSKLQNIPECYYLNLYVFKHFERGYGFYNEFGYMYIPRDIDLQFISSEEIIKFSNTIILELNKFRHSKFENLSEDIQKYKYLAEIIESIKSITSITISQLIKYIMSYCKNPKDTSHTNNLLYKLGSYKVLEIIDALDRYLLNILKQKTSFSNDDDMTYFKLYEYGKDQSYSISVSTLVNKDSDEHRHFEMTPMKKYDLKLEKSNEHNFTLTIS